MHLFIVSTLVIDVFVWNVCDLVWFFVLFSRLRNDDDDDDVPAPLLVVWLVAHACYAIYGHLVPDSMPYVVAHRHSAGNFSQGVLVVKKTAAEKLLNRHFATRATDYLLVHSVLFFDALVAHLRFDGLSNVDLVKQLAAVCGFEEGDCVLAWVGAFPSFVLEASRKLVDSARGVIKQGKYKAFDLMDPRYKNPSDIPKTNIPALVKKAD
ncbi:hypothetical protein CTAYLR_009768 [Chrysophaeum taylorii]|uniref:Uncharacterized protein n=1 Tax=Chrysophaeum taylorii TaxID=2483200 RepID=A0AAD7ULI2_9STRA|nr:hypothetical protein CTAYLR_009768 [Chrysophaeum taylorii]